MFVTLFYVRYCMSLLLRLGIPFLYIMSRRAELLIMILVTQSQS